MNRSMISCILFAAAMTGAANAGGARIRVSDVWSRPASGTGVIYATIRNAAAKPDSLIGATSPLATHVDLHESSQTHVSGESMSGGSMSGMPMSGPMMSMKSLSVIPIPAAGTTRLEPGGYHLMLVLRRDLRPGETVPLRLHFARAGWVAATATVRPIR